MKLEVLVTTMHQTDLSKYKSMNLQTDAIIANQADRNEYCEEEINGHQVKMITTDTRGISRNRNIALAHSSQKADFLLFSDDDLVLSDGYEEIIVAEFEKHPATEAIKFNIHDLSATRKISMKRIERFEKATRRNMSSSGVCGLVVKQEALKAYNLHFHENFGPGTANKSGEDTIFLMEMLDKGLSVYRSPVDIAGIDQTESSWFDGYTAEYFQIAGKILYTCYPHIAHILAIRSAYKFSKREKCTLRFNEILKNYNIGIRTAKG